MNPQRAVELVPANGSAGCIEVKLESGASLKAEP